MLRPIKIKQYLSALQKLALDPTRLLSGTGLTPAILGDPACLVDMQQSRTVVSNLISLTGDQGIGLKMGAQAEMADFGIIAHAMMSSPTLRQAVDYWIQYSNLVGMLIHLTLLEEGGDWVVVFSGREPLGLVYNFAVEEILVTGIKIGSLMTGRTLEVRAITVSYPAPLHADTYSEYFPCPVHFNAGQTSIIIRAPSLDAPLPTQNEELNDVFKRHCGQLTRQIGHGDPITAKVRGILLATRSDLPTLPVTAKRLGMSPRSLRRHLAAEGSTYQHVLDGFRFDMASEYLRSRNLAVKQIADLLGFRDVNSFRRAFKSWSGCTIQDFRATDFDMVPMAASHVGLTRPRFDLH